MKLLLIFATSLGIAIAIPKYSRDVAFQDFTEIFGEDNIAMPSFRRGVSFEAPNARPSVDIRHPAFKSATQHTLRAPPGVRPFRYDPVSFQPYQFIQHHYVQEDSGDSFNQGAKQWYRQRPVFIKQAPTVPNGLGLNFVQFSTAPERGNPGPFFIPSNNFVLPGNAAEPKPEDDKKVIEVEAAVPFLLLKKETQENEIVRAVEEDKKPSAEVATKEVESSNEPAQEVLKNNKKNDEVDIEKESVVLGDIENANDEDTTDKDFDVETATENDATFEPEYQSLSAVEIKQAVDLESEANFRPEEETNTLQPNGELGVDEGVGEFDAQVLDGNPDEVDVTEESATIIAEVRKKLDTSLKNKNQLR